MGVWGGGAGAHTFTGWDGSQSMWSPLIASILYLHLLVLLLSVRFLVILICSRGSECFLFQCTRGRGLFASIPPGLYNFMCMIFHTLDCREWSTTLLASMITTHHKSASPNPLTLECCFRSWRQPQWSRASQVHALNGVDMGWQSNLMDKHVH